jgi:alkylhydroperoxidase family enzyme
MRIPYVSDPPPAATPDEEAIISRIRARRAPRPLQPLDLALLHSAPVADGWNSFLGAVRTRTTLAADLRELAISRVASVNRAWYEWGHHAPLAVAAGVDAALLAADGVVAQGGTPLRLADGAGAGAKGFSERQWVVLVYADEMTRNVEVSDETFAKLKELFSEKEVVEITATVRLPRPLNPRC